MKNTKKKLMVVLLAFALTQTGCMEKDGQMSSATWLVLGSIPLIAIGVLATAK
ncbi:MAG: hypothetical protein QM529_06235 [Hydrotalea sp.]|nr:hypothetical protein [Hydrotalea sp.]